MTKNFINKELNELLKKLKQHKSAFVFQEKIENIIALYPLYKEVISKPIDLNIIESKVLNKEYNNCEELKKDMHLMFDNCRTFNRDCQNYVTISNNMQNFFDNNFKKVELKIQKFIEKSEQNDKITGKSSLNSNLNLLYPKSNISLENNKIAGIFETTEEDKIYEKIYNLFFRLSGELENDVNIEEHVNCITKSLLKRNKSLDTLSEETSKWVSLNVKNKEDKELKPKFLKKFRKFIKSIKDEQVDDSSKMNIKVNLNQNMNIEKIKSSKEAIEQAIKVSQDFLDNQKVPEVYRETDQYPIDPILKEKIVEYINFIDSKYRGVFS